MLSATNEIYDMYKATFKKQTREEFEKERAEIIKRSFEEAKDPGNRIPYEDLPWYLDQIRTRLYGRKGRLGE